MNLEQVCLLWVNMPISLDSQGDGFGVALQSRSPLVTFCKQRGQGGGGGGGSRAPPATPGERSRGPQQVPGASACAQQTAGAPGTPCPAGVSHGHGGGSLGVAHLPPPQRKCCQHLTQALTPGATPPALPQIRSHEQGMPLMAS